MIGPWDYILTTIQSLIYLAEPAQTIVNHSRSPLWAPYITYLLVPPAVGLACYAAFGGRLKDVIAKGSHRAHRATPGHRFRQHNSSSAWRAPFRS